MRHRSTWMLFLCIGFLLSPVLAEDTFQDIQELDLQAVHKDTPNIERTKDSEWGSRHNLKMVKVQNQPQIKTPPVTEAAVLYYGEIQLGIPAKSYGILVDFEGNDKVLWVDSNADGDFSQEPAYQIFKSDRFPGANIYYSPEPLVFQTSYSFNNQLFDIPIQFDLTYLVVSRVGHADFFHLKTRTWLIGALEDNGEETRLAVVDTNDNGYFIDPEDLFFVDENYDLNFSDKEGKPLKKIKKIKLKSGMRLTPQFESIPGKLILSRR